MDEAKALRAALLAAHNVASVAQRIATQVGLGSVVEEAVRGAAQLCSADGASLLLVDAQTGELSFDVVSGEGADRLRQVRLAKGEGLAGQVAQSGQPVRVAAAHQVSQVAAKVDGQGGFSSGALLAVPLLLLEQTVGVLEVVRATGKPAFTVTDQESLTALAPHVAAAVHHARLREELRTSKAQVIADNAALEQKVALRTEQLSRGKREWEATFDAINEPIALQEGFLLRRVNRAFAQASGLPIQGLPGQLCHQALAGRDSPCPGCPLVAKPRELTGELVFGGTTFFFNAFRISAHLDDARVVTHYRDVTQEKALRDRLRETERLASLGQLASGAAHEINNPMASLTANLQVLEGLLADLLGPAELSPQLARLLSEASDAIRESLGGARRVTEVVKGLRELSRLQVDEAKPTSLNDAVLRAAHALFGPPPNPLELMLESGGRVNGYPLQLDQAVTHLLRNARWAVVGGGTVRVRTWDDQAHTLLEVCDTGCGISPDNLPRIFDPFFTTRSVGEGVGLGLTATWGVVKRHGGTIDVRSVLGEGTTFTVRLPLTGEPLERRRQPTT